MKAIHATIGPHVENTAKGEETLHVLDIEALIVAILAVVVAIVLYLLQRRIEHRDIIKHSCDSIKRELEHNKEALTGKKHKMIIYRIHNNEDVNFINAFLESSSYDSIVYSGHFTRLRVDTQYTLTTLYARIRSRNELIRYTEIFEDIFFLYENSQDRHNIWYTKIQKYDILLTQWELEIKELLPEAEDKIQNEIHWWSWYNTLFRRHK